MVMGEQPFSDKNEDGEDITISGSKNCNADHTYQKNGWIRRNMDTFSDGGIISEELFDGKQLHTKTGALHFCRALLLYWELK